MATTALKAIETHYAGHRFRSRLEARWAVFFDTVGIRWEYEAQGYELEHRISRRGGHINYLPDFWLPDLSAHFEVKGQLDSDKDLLRLIDCAASLSAPHGGCGDGPNLVVGGPIPEPGAGRHPTVLHMHKGGLYAAPLPRGTYCNDGEEIAVDYGGSLGDVCSLHPNIIRDILINGSPMIDGRYDHGYTAARKARFEHGEHGR